MNWAISDTVATPYERDYLQGRLKTPLAAGIQYCVTIYACLTPFSGYACNNIGAYFDDGTIDTTENCGQPQTTHIPQVEETAIISDALNWTKIQGIVTGSGTEKFMTIGNFRDEAHTDTLLYPASWLLGNGITWYIIDDISVIEIDSTADAGPDATIPVGDSAWIGTQDDYLPCKWYYASTGALIDSNHAGMWVHPTTTTSYVMELDVCGTLSYDTVTVTVASTGVDGIHALGNARVFPNPVKDLLSVSGLVSTAHYRLLNTLAMCIQQGELTGGGSIAVGALPAGVYVLELTDNDSNQSEIRVVKE